MLPLRGARVGATRGARVGATWLRAVRGAVWDELTLLAAKEAHHVPPGVARGLRHAVDVAQRPFASSTRALDAQGETRLLHVGDDLQLRAAIARRVGGVTLRDGPRVFRPTLEPDDFSDAQADVVSVEIDRGRARAFAERGWLVLPRWVAFAVDLRHENARWDAKKREEVRRVERAGLEVEVVEARRAVREFYDSMYVPTAVARHGALAYVRSFRFVERASASGHVLFVRRGGERRAGMLLVERANDPHRVDALLMGLRGGDFDRADDVVRDALYLFAIRWARDVRHATTFGLTSAVPFADDGLFRFKKRWGGVAAVPEHDGRAVALRLARATPALIESLAGTVLVHLDPVAGSSEPAGLAATTLASPGAQPNARATPGISPTVVLRGEGPALVDAFSTRARAASGRAT